MEESVSLGVILGGGFSPKLCIPFHRADDGTNSLYDKRSRVRGDCCGRHALIYGAILQDRGTVYVVVDPNTGLSDSPVF